MDISNKSEYGQRLREARTEQELSREKFSKVLGIHPNTLKSWENGGTAPNDFYQSIIEERTNINTSWLRTGEGNMFIKDAAIRKLTSKNNANKEFRVWGITGAGHRYDYNMQDEDPENHKPMETIPISSILNGQYLDGFKVSGDSMEPAIMDGAYIAVNFKDKRLRTGSLFVFNYPHEGLVVKKVQVKKDVVKIYSYNELYDPEEYAHAELDEHVIVGRVVWIHNKV